MLTRVVPLVPLVLVTAFLASASAQPPPRLAARADQSERVQRGVAHFDRAFFDLTPRKRDAEAAREFDLAIAEFEGELAARPASAIAHRYLARIFAARKEFRKAAAHYDALTDLDPLDVDDCVLAALAYVDDGQVAEARARLLLARRRTSDPAALARLTEYLSRLDEIKR